VLPLHCRAAGCSEWRRSVLPVDCRAAGCSVWRRSVFPVHCCAAGCSDWRRSVLPVHCRAAGCQKSSCSRKVLRPTCHLETDCVGLYAVCTARCIELAVLLQHMHSVFVNNICCLQHCYMFRCTHIICREFLVYGKVIN